MFCWLSHNLSNSKFVQVFQYLYSHFAVNCCRLLIIGDDNDVSKRKSPDGLESLSDTGCYLIHLLISSQLIWNWRDVFNDFFAKGGNCFVLGVFWRKYTVVAFENKLGGFVVCCS